MLMEPAPPSRLRIASSQSVIRNLTERRNSAAVRPGRTLSPPGRDEIGSLPTRHVRFSRCVRAPSARPPLGKDAERNGTAAAWVPRPGPLGAAQVCSNQ
jgi:hypothetical protein